jgi:fatty acid desaturase
LSRPKRELENFRLREVSMFLTLAIILAAIWLVLWLALHVTSGLIHILIAVAVISFIVHLFRGRPATT